MPRARTSTRPLFQRRQYEFIADVLKAHRMRAADNGELDAVDEIDRLAQTFGVKLGSTNPAFDYQRFMRACGVEARSPAAPAARMPDNRVTGPDPRD